MKVKMKEYYQGTDVQGYLLSAGNLVKVLEPENVYDVSAALGAWLIENGKAEAVTAARHYGAQPEPESRHDEEIHDALMSTESMEKKSKRSRK